MRVLGGSHCSYQWSLIASVCRQQIDGCKSDHPLVVELKHVMNLEGIGKVVSLSRLRSIVAVHSGMEELASGNQQDAVEFLTFFLNMLPLEFTFHMRREDVSFKYMINNNGVQIVEIFQKIELSRKIFYICQLQTLEELYLYKIW